MRWCTPEHTMSQTKSSEAKKQSTEAAPKARRKHTGVAKRMGAKRVGKRVSLVLTDAATPARSAEAQLKNSRSEIAGGRKDRNAAHVNVEAFSLIRTMCAKLMSELTSRGLTSSMVNGAVIVHDRLGVIVEVEALSATAGPSPELLDKVAFIG